MPAHKQFSPDAALEKAMVLFWRRGFVAVSMSDLVAATGASRYGLYDEFGDKRALFFKALDLYERLVSNALLGDLKSEGANRSSLVSYGARLEGHLSSSAGLLGCMIANAAVEVGAGDEEIALRCDEYHQRLIRCFETAFSAAGAYDPKAEAGLCAATVQGAMQLARVSGRADTAIEAVKLYFAYKLG